MKYYAVKHGRNPGIYNDWETCKKQVTNFKGAIYKKFDTKAEAEIFLATNGDAPTGDKHNLIKVENLRDDEGIVYVDGSFRLSDSSYSYGYLIVTKTNKIEDSKRFYDDKYSKFRNVVGEVFAAQKSIERSIELGLKKIYLHHDYSGIRHWALKEWKANNELTQSYRDFFQNISSVLQVDFIKVEAHTGVEYNELVDKLAKEAK